MLDLGAQSAHVALICEVMAWSNIGDGGDALTYPTHTPR